MFSFYDLLVSLGVAVGLIFLFKLQRELSPRTYFSMSDIIYGINSSPTRMDVVIRVMIIFIAGIICNFFIDNPNVIILGLTLGSFLIVWPAFLSEKNIHPSVIEKKLLVYTLLSLLVITTFLISKLSILVYNFGGIVYKTYIQVYSFELLIVDLVNNLFWMLLTLAMGIPIKLLKNYLNKEINLSSTRYLFEEDSDSEVAATIASENEKNDNEK